jgi:16S rRNA (cytidine1402-2'-O)-methyltransferase
MMTMKTGTLYLIPTTMGECDLNRVLPSYNNVIIKSLQHFIVEDIRTARRFLKKVDREIVIDNLSFSTLNEQTPQSDIEQLLTPLIQSHDVGVISEAGCPAIADPGADIVRLAQQKNIRVVPLVGPSSILMSLMASGFNGQNFAFVGYLPIEQQERGKALKNLEKKVFGDNQTQIFIETPYRNLKLMEEILRNCSQQTHLCVATDISLPTEFIQTKTLSEWKRQLPDIQKRPTIFLLGR